MRKIITFILISCVFFLQAQKRPYQKLVWSDEFNGTGLADSTKWSYDIGDGCPNVCGWGNHELQYYTVGKKENASVSNGVLTITARKELTHGMQYSSARLVTRGKASWKYGRIEVRAKIPKGLGIWPAIWMLPESSPYGGWPGSGEIDIMEYVGFWPDSAIATFHTKVYNGIYGTQKTALLHSKTLHDKFHVYEMEWTPEYIAVYMDRKLINRFSNDHKGYETWPFDQPFHLLLNVAVGGDFGGRKGVDETIFPRSMEVDYVRVYQ